MEENLQKLIWMLEMALEQATTALNRIRGNESPATVDANQAVIVHIPPAKSRRKKSKQEGNKKMTAEKKNRSQAMKDSWVRRNRNKKTNGKLSGKVCEKQTMKCSVCQEEFVYSGLLLDAVCPACGTGAVRPT